MKKFLALAAALVIGSVSAFAYDFSEDNAGIVTESGVWEKTEDTVIVLTNDNGEENTLLGIICAEKEGFGFAGWQTHPEVTKDDLIYGVSPL